MPYLYFSIVTSIAIFTWGTVGLLRARKYKIRDKQVKETTQSIYKGVSTLLYKEYRALIIFVLIIGAFLYSFISHNMAWAFLSGIILNFIAINLGARIAILHNAQTVEVLKNNKKEWLRVALKSSNLISLIMTSTGLFGIGLIYLIFGDLQIIYGVGLGASLSSLFVKLGGGVHIKAIDIGVSWLDEFIFSIEKRSHLVIDSIGDNIKEISGNNSDLFGSFVSTIIATMVIGGVGLFVFLPITLATVGVITTIAGIIFIKTKKNEFFSSKILKQGMFGAILLDVCLSALVIRLITGSFILFSPFLIGVIIGVVIYLVTGFSAFYKIKTTQKLTMSTQFSPIINILKGLSWGIKSGLVPIFAIFLMIWSAYLLENIYGIAIAVIGMFSIVSIILIINGFNSIIENTINIAKKIDLDKVALAKINKIDTVRKTAIANNRGFALSATMLTVFVLLINYSIITEIGIINILTFKTIIGLIIGGLLPFLFSSFVISSIGRISAKIIKELRRQFKKTSKFSKKNINSSCDDYAMTNIGITTREITISIIMAITIVPILVGFFLGANALGALLISASMVGFFLMTAMSNSGAILGSSRRLLTINNFDGQKLETYKHFAISGFAGDFLKNVTGPSISILLKLIAIIALIIAPFIG